MSEKLLPDDVDFDGPFPRLSRRLRLGIVGGGRISVTQASAARLSDRWEIVAGALSSDPDTAKRRGADRYLPEDRCYASFDRMAVEESQRPDGVDAVMITTPNHVHFEAARTFIDAGIDVLCDKPLTNDVAEAEELVRLTGDSGRVFAVGYVFSAFPMVRQARRMVTSGAIGRVIQIHAEFMQDWLMTEGAAEADHVKWRLDPARSGATSCTGDIGTHALHTAAFISGLELTGLRAEMHVLGGDTELEDTVMMMTRFTGGVPGTLMATRYAAGNRGGLRVRIFGDEGGLEWDMEHPEQLRFTRYGDPDQVLSRGQGAGIHPSVERLTRLARGFTEGVIEAWANLYTEFALAVAAGKDGIVPPAGWLGYPKVEDGARGVRFVEAAVTSHRAGGEWVSCGSGEDS